MRILNLLATVLIAVVAVPAAFADSFTWEGRVQYRDRNGDLQPLRHAEVAIEGWRYDPFPFRVSGLFVNTHTDEDGDFSISFSLPTNREELRLHVNASSVQVEIHRHGSPFDGLLSADDAIWSGPWIAAPTSGNATYLSSPVIDDDEYNRRIAQTFDWVQQSIRTDDDLDFNPPRPSPYSKHLYWVRPETDSTPTQSQIVPYLTINTPATELSWWDADLKGAVLRHAGWQWLQYCSMNEETYPAATEPLPPSDLRTHEDAWTEGFMNFYAALHRGSPLLESSVSSTTTWTENFETNWDGDSIPNGNDDGFNDSPSNWGYDSSRAIAAMLWDMYDSSSTLADPYDRTTIPLSLIRDTMVNVSGRIATAQEFLGEYDTQDHPKAPLVWGAAQIHGMTQNRGSRPTLGLAAFNRIQPTWYFHGGASAECEFRNYGSQPYTFDVGAGSSCGVFAKNPSGLSYTGGTAMLGENPETTPIGAGGTLLFNAYVSNFWPEADPPSGVYSLEAYLRGTDGTLRRAVPTEDGVENTLAFTPVKDTTPPDGSVMDFAEWQASTSTLLVFVGAQDIESGLAGIEYALGTTPNGTDVQGFAPGAPYGGHFYSGFSVPPGTRVYATVRLTNFEGLASIITSDGITMGDSSPPHTVKVEDDGIYQNSTSTLQFLTSAQENISPLVRLDYCIGTSASSIDNLIPWTTQEYLNESEALTNVTRLVSLTGLALPHHSKVFISVRWTNAADLETIVTSNGIWTSGYAAWAESEGLSGIDAQPNATPFGDGVQNLLKYAFNMDGSGADAGRMTEGSGVSGLPSIRVVGNILRFEFVRRSAGGVSYTPKISSTLVPGSWQMLTDEPSLTPVTPGWERVVYEEPIPIGAQKLFGVVVVED